jgi:DNA-binding NarL/FixJ family response regulator
MTNLVHRCADKPARLSVPVPRPAKKISSAGTFFALDAHDRCERLHPRQRELLTLLSKGLDQRQIADAMGISVHTVREHKQRVYLLLEVNSAVEAAVLAAKAGLA